MALHRETNKRLIAGETEIAAISAAAVVRWSWKSFA